MHTKSRNLVLASAITLALATASGSAIAHPMEEHLSQARQESQISTTYALSPYLRSGDINVSARAGTATLTGTVMEDISRQLAEQIALGADGITSVDNQITVDPDHAVAKPASEERSFGEVVDDATITATVKSKLLWSKSTEGLDMNVDTRRGKVTLLGTAETGESREISGRMAKNTRGVISVDNQLEVDDVGSDSQAVDAASPHESSQPIADSWITTKVKSTYMFTRNVENSDISVSTKEGRVTLSGTVGSGAERALATELAMNIRGVESVDATELKF